LHNIILKNRKNEDKKIILKKIVKTNGTSY